MKKMIKSLVIGLALVGLVAGGAFAVNPGQNPNDDSAVSTGVLNIDSDAFGYGVDYDYYVLPMRSGVAGGIGGAVGGAEAGAAGIVDNGEVSADVATWGGGFTNTTAVRSSLNGERNSILVGSRTETYALTGGSVDVAVDPDGNGFDTELVRHGWGYRPVFTPTASGAVGGEASGFTAQGSLNGSIVGKSPLNGWETEGFSAGVAGQASIGGFTGVAGAVSGPDDRSGCHQYDSNAEAGFSTEVEMIGFSGTTSYRFMNNDNGLHTEGMGSNVNAETEVNTYGTDYDHDRGMSEAYGNVEGGYLAAGGAATKTVQFNDNGKATATALGGYVGIGELNSNFVGKANGYSYTQVTTNPTMNGSIVSSGAGMTVTATNNSGVVQDR